MLIYENKKQRFLNILKVGISPFQRFVSTNELQEKLQLVGSRKIFLSSIVKIVETNENFFLPIIGSTGTGKTHLFWTLKKRLHYFNTIFISLENVYRKFYYNVYSEFIEDIGNRTLRNFFRELCREWGASEKKFGFFRVFDIEKVRKSAFQNLMNKFEDKIALMDIINAITTHQLDPYKKNLAENWLLGELMDYKDLSQLNLSDDLRHKTYPYTMLKLLVENSDLKSIIFIDNFEKIISLMKQEETTEVIYDPSWLYGNAESSPDKIAGRKILEKILNLQKIKGLRIIITLNSIDSLEEIKKYVSITEKNLLLTFKEPLFLSNFVDSDIFKFYKEHMKHFLKEVDYLEFLDEYPESYYPLNEKILKIIQNLTDGNPQEIIKTFIKIFNDIIFSDDNLEDILTKYENA